MLIQFSFGNFRSFRDQVTLSLVAANEPDPSVERDALNVFLARESPRLDLLRVAAIYGANASGKSNIRLALAAFQECVEQSANVKFKYDVMPFFYDVDSHGREVFFEIIVLKDGTTYRYGFSVLPQLDKQQVQSEWLYQSTTDSEDLVFERDGLVVNGADALPGISALLDNGRMRRKEALFLSTSAQLGIEEASALVATLCGDIHEVSGLSDAELKRFTLDCLREGDYREVIERMAAEADTGIERIDIISDDEIPAPQLHFLSSLPEEIREAAKRRYEDALSLIAYHPVYTRDGQRVGSFSFPVDFSESEGTKKLIAYSGPIMSALDHGDVVFVDEIDARLHPLMTRAIISLFQSPESNPKNAQLIFITHDPSLLSANHLREDQIWFVEKDRFGVSHLYSLEEIRDVQPSDRFDQDYLRGRYGAIPFLGGLKRAITASRVGQPLISSEVVDA